MITPDLAAPSHNAAPTLAAQKVASPGPARLFAEFVTEGMAGDGAKDTPSPEPRALSVEEIELAPEAGAVSILPAFGGEFGESASPLVRPEVVCAASFDPVPGHAARAGAMSVENGVLTEGGMVHGREGVTPAHGEAVHVGRRASSVAGEDVRVDARADTPSAVDEPSDTSVLATPATQGALEAEPIGPAIAPQPAEGAGLAAPSGSFLSSAPARRESGPSARDGLPPAQERTEGHVEAVTGVTRAPLVSLASSTPAATPVGAPAPAPADEGSAPAAVEPRFEAAGLTTGSAAPAAPAAPIAPGIPSTATAVPAAALASAATAQATEPAAEARSFDPQTREGEAPSPPVSAPVAAPIVSEARSPSSSASFGLEQLQSSAEPGWRLSTSERSAALEKALTGPAAPRELAGQITVAVTQSTQPQLEIRLDPPELGRVQIQLNPTERGGLQAVVLADRPETQDFLRRNAETLVRDLTEAGYADVSLEFATGGDHARQDPRPQERFFAPAFEPAPFLAPAPEPLRRTTASGGLDIRL